MLDALPPADAVAVSVVALEVDGDIHVVAGAGVVDEGLDVLAEAAPVVLDVEREPQPAGEPV